MSDRQKNRLGSTNKMPAVPKSGQFCVLDSLRRRQLNKDVTSSTCHSVIAGAIGVRTVLLVPVHYRVMNMCAK